MENTERNTLTRGSLMLPARPQAAKQETSRQKGATLPGLQERSVDWGLPGDLRLSRGVLDGSHHSTPFLRMRFPYRAVSPVMTTA